MPTPSELLDALRQSKTRSLQQRLTAIVQLPQQVAGLRAQAEQGGVLEQHQSQIDALQGFLAKLQKIIDQRWTALQATQDSTAFFSLLTVPDNLESLVRAIYRVWRFYQERFDQRRSADAIQQRFLIVADGIAWDAYNRCINRAREMSIIAAGQEFKQPPLLHLYDAPSPVIYARRHTDIPNMPVHVIDMPYADTSAVWSLVALHHEIVHGLVADWGLSLDGFVLVKAREAGLKLDRVDRWCQWAEEIFADFVAVLIGGPPFIRELMDILASLGPGQITSKSPHPPNYLRIPLLCAFLNDLESKRPGKPNELEDNEATTYYRKLSEQYAVTWQALYSGVDATAFQPFMDERETIIKLLTDTPIPELQSHTARELGTFGPADLRLIRRVAEDQLVYGVPAGEAIAPRFAVSATRMAFDIVSAAQNGVAQPKEQLEALHNSALETIENNIVPGVRAAPDEKAFEMFLEQLADNFARNAPGWDAS